MPHMAVLQFPGSDGAQPGTLAERAGTSKQAMNRLLESLEDLGHLARNDAPHEGRTHGILRDVEHEWSAELGPKDFAQLKALLSRVWESPLIDYPAVEID
jgi:hypothetical protein